MELQHFSHTHLLIFKEDEWSHESDDHKADCSACGQVLSGASFGCVGCGFYLHKQCAEAPVEMDHPFHPKHSLTLLQKQPYLEGCRCNFCGKTCEHFVYHCSCKVDLHIKCAFLSYNIAKKELQHIARIDPLISRENHGEELKKAQCFACWKPLLDSEYLYPDSGFHIHAKCVDLPFEIDHLLHQQHPLFLQFNNECLSCDVCENTQQRGFVYYCPPCKFVLDIDCAAIPTEIHHFSHLKHPLLLKFNYESLTCEICEVPKKGLVYYCTICKFAIHCECTTPPTIEQEKHPHPFHLLNRRDSYICDACGTPGNYVSYTCLACSIIVHKKCISWPSAIKFRHHHHHLVLKYFLRKDELEMPECRICYELVKPEYGNYFCSQCKYIIHVNCLLEGDIYHDLYDEDTYEAPYVSVTDTCIDHFSHHHYLEFKNMNFDLEFRDDKQCDGCLLFISTSYYYCSQCDFFLHETCAELSLKRNLWFHYHQVLAGLTSGDFYTCSVCEYETNGFAYKCYKCDECFCLRCALVSNTPLCEGHGCSLLYSPNFEGLCNACGDTTSYPYRCKSCNFNLHDKCLRLPLKVRHKSDIHLLKLTYGDRNNYSENHYCDICEEKRNPNHWFYHCAICDNSIHVKCAIDEYSFIKLGSICTKEDHPHPLTIVKKVHYYPKCCQCNKYCFDLALECKEVMCNYIVHWICQNPFQRRLPFPRLLP